jgi:predicted RNase H-like HicB family nuclease
MKHYIAVIQEDEDTGFEVSFPDLAGVFTAGDTMDEAVEQAADLLEFAAENWLEDTGKAFPQPRTMEDLRADAAFMATLGDGVLVPVPFDDEVANGAAH